MNTHTISFAIQGMYCVKCAVSIERALTRLDGVIAAQVNYATERAAVVFDPTHVAGAAMVSAVRGEGFSVSLERVVLNVGDLLYASSPHTVANALRRTDGVADVSIDSGARQISVDIFSQHGSRPGLERALGQLGFHITETQPSNSILEFVIRTLLTTALALLMVTSASEHAGFISQTGLFHVPFVVIGISFLALFGAGLPFYRSAYDAFLQGEFDASVLLALIASGLFFASVPLMLVVPTAWLTGIAPVIATTLTASWFITRGLTALVLPRVAKQQLAVTKRLLPFVVGVLAAFAMFALYVFILTVFQDFSHAMQQATQDWLWVGLVALGFGTQIGLYTHLRLRISAAKAAGATATLAPAVNASAGVTGTGTGTSTLGMVACCAHHLTDLAPLVALMGASSLSGAITFLNGWKYPFITLGLVVNAIGILITLRALWRSRAKWNAMSTSSVAETVPACH